MVHTLAVLLADEQHIAAFAVGRQVAGIAKRVEHTVTVAVDAYLTRLQHLAGHHDIEVGYSHRHDWFLEIFRQALGEQFLKLLHVHTGHMQASHLREYDVSVGVDIICLQLRACRH